MSLRIPKITAYNIVERMEEWLQSGESPLSGVDLCLDGRNYLARQGLNVFVRVEGKEQIWSYRTANLQPALATEIRCDFRVHNIGMKPEDIERMQRAILSWRESFENSSDVKHLDRIFSSPTYDYMEVGFGSSSYKGVSLSTALKRVELGQQGRISGSLFILAERGLAEPLRELI